MLGVEPQGAAFIGAAGIEAVEETEETLELLKSSSLLLSSLIISFVFYFYFKF